MTWDNGPDATDKQISYIKSLLKKKHGTEHINAEIRGRYDLTQREARFGFTKREASTLIEKLKKPAVNKTVSVADPVSIDPIAGAKAAARAIGCTPQMTEEQWRDRIRMAGEGDLIALTEYRHAEGLPGKLVRLIGLAADRLSVVMEAASMERDYGGGSRDYGGGSRDRDDDPDNECPDCGMPWSECGGQCA